jgi:hypothetical protein
MKLLLNANLMLTKIQIKLQFWFGECELCRCFLIWEYR